MASNARPVSLGQLRVKLRLRKPIAEAMRYHRDMGEVREAARDASATGDKQGPAGPRQCIVTIQVDRGQDLKVGYGNVAQIAPFFYYQFFTFEEKYSHAATGCNPSFQDTQAYTMTFDDGTLRYLEAETLDIAFFDDNAPVAGVERGGQSTGQIGQEVDDLIGISKIPLRDLAKRIGINGDFDILDARGQRAGKVVLKISIVDTSAGTTASMTKTQKELNEMQKMSYTDKWEADIIAKIAKKLSKRSIDVELMFGIFARGAKSCTHEDFKYCCLQRLNLKYDLSEKELDMFLNGHARLKGKNTIEQRDFVELFSNAIIKARNETQNQEALDRTLMLKYGDMMEQREQDMQRSAMDASMGRRPSALSHSRTGEGVSLLDF